MTLLALETSSEACSVALCSVETLFQRHEVTPLQHAKVILDWIAAVMLESHLTLKDLSAVAYSCGPGSFTGIRIGCAVAQGIALGIDKPLLAIPSLQVIAQGVYRRKGFEKVMILLDARMGHVYRGFYTLGTKGLMIAAQPDSLRALSDIDTPPKNEAGEWGLVADNPELVERVPSFKFREVVTNFYPCAIDILPLAKERIIENKVPPLDQALPLYLRTQDAWKKHP